MSTKMPHTVAAISEPARSPSPVAATNRNGVTLEPPVESTPWINPFCFNPCDDEDGHTCLLGWFCPGILYGKTQERLRRIQLGQDPLDETGFTLCTPGCLYVGGLCIFTQHDQIRQTYNIRGECAEDCAKSFCFPGCTLIQADREVKSRAALDEKQAGNGIFAGPYDTSNQQMRYVAPNKIFGGGSAASAEGTRKPSAKVATVDSAPQENPPAIASLDGTVTMPPIELNHLTQKIQVASQSPSRVGTFGQRDGDSETTVVHTKQHSSNKGTGSAVKSKKVDQNDETVFVYYNSPTTPEPQKLRDCVKTNTSESTAGAKLDLGNSRARSSASTTDSCVVNEKLSFEEPAIRDSIRAMLSIEKETAARSKSTAYATGQHKQSTELSDIPESIQSDGSNRNMALLELSKSKGASSEETITNAKYNGPEPSQANVEKIETNEGHNDEGTPGSMHPLSRDSTIMPCTPLALEEVKEEIDVDGELKVPQEGKAGAMTVGWKYGRKVRPSFFDGNSEP